MIDKESIDRLASRVLDNLRRADFDPSGNCFLAARALQILANQGELVEGYLNDERHVWYAVEDGPVVIHWDVTADGCGGTLILSGLEELPDSYRDYIGWDWPEQYSTQFAEDLIALVRPNGGGL